jgi:hypothetical protein
MGKANVPSAFGLGPASLHRRAYGGQTGRADWRTPPNRPSGGRALPQITFLGSKT